MKKLIAIAATGALLAFSPAYAADKNTPPPPRLANAMAKLPAEKSQLVKTTLTTMQKEWVLVREQSKKLQEQIRTILLAQDFDRAAFMDAHQKLFDLQSAQHKKDNDTLADLASKLTPDERKALVEILPQPGTKKAAAKKPTQ